VKVGLAVYRIYSKPARHADIHHSDTSLNCNDVVAVVKQLLTIRKLVAGQSQRAIVATTKTSCQAYFLCTQVSTN